MSSKFLRKRSYSQVTMNGDDLASLRRQRKEEKSIRRYWGESSNTQVTASDFETVDSCVLRDFPKHKSTHLQFLSWVSYTRQYALPSITDEERRTCPLLWCRQVFLNQEEMLRHVWNCEKLSKGLYWCFQCQKPETVGTSKCGGCHGSRSKTDRIANIARKMFSALGRRDRCPSPAPSSSSCRPKIVDVDETPYPMSPDTVHWNRDEKRETQHRHVESNPSMQELSNTGLCEMEGAPYVPEMAADWRFSQELPTSRADDLSQERNLGSMEAFMYSSPWDFLNSAHTSHQISPRPSRSALPRLNTSTVELLKTVQESIVDWTENPMSATIVSPLSPTGGFDYSTLEAVDPLKSPTFSPTDISPTDSEASGNSLFTDSGYSTATFESSWNGSDISFDSMQLFETSKGKGKETFSQPIDLLDSHSGFSAQPIETGSNNMLVLGAIVSNSHNSSSFAATENNRVLSPHWSDAKGLVRSFCEVLTEHLQHSRRSLQAMAPSAIIRELLSLSLSTIVSIGFGVLEGLLEGRYPKIVMPLFSFTHIAYALAITVDSDQSNVRTSEWFLDLLSMIDHISSDKQRQAYTQIVRVIWQPRDAAVVVDSTSCAVSSMAREKLQESFVYREKIEAIQSAIPHFNYMHPSFASTAKTRIINELIKNNSTVAFIQDVAGVNVRLEKGLIVELRQLELELICAGRVASQSESLYDSFMADVTSLCDNLYNENPSFKSRNQHHFEAISYTQQLISQEDIEEDEVELFDFAQSMKVHHDEGFGTLQLDEAAQPSDGLFSMDTNMIPQGNGGSEVLLVAHSAPIIPYFDTQPEPYSSQNFACNGQWTPNTSIIGVNETKPKYEPPSGTQSPAVRSKYRCHCGYEPTGEEKWKPSNLVRHKRIQHATTKYTCGFRGCKSTFTRSDNLRSHQRDKGHLLVISMSDKPPDRDDGGKGRKKRRIERRAPPPQEGDLI
ncbi:hypothetical protein BJ878DRAFT_484148 [Calycina marina]|uniref:C2H2-type domain-containing protein n=1 Tax=Calycina marina TaxID=1763456 RepID=A0A9P7YVE8_9HELO|nr:hypothetical protein BJ878DRAFT_484148 [Calycina marina]